MQIEDDSFTVNLLKAGSLHERVANVSQNNKAEQNLTLTLVPEACLLSDG